MKAKLARRVKAMKYTAEQIIKFIDEMDNAERWKLVEKLYYKFFNKEHFIEEPPEEKEEDY
jgi:hypothetical protein